MGAIIQAQIKENTKATRHWPLWGEFTGTGEFPAQMASNAENVPIWWRHHGTEKVMFSIYFGYFRRATVNLQKKTGDFTKYQDISANTDRKTCQNFGYLCKW